jgi:hypothetical protein
MDACPGGFFIGTVKTFTFSRSKSGIFALALNKIEHFSKVSRCSENDIKTMGFKGYSTF